MLVAIEATVRSRNLTALVSRVGCLGLCFAEPLVDVQLPGQARVFYGNVTPQLVEEIVESHLGRGVPVDRLALGRLGEPSIAGISDLNQHPMRAKENRVAMRNVGNIDPGDIYQYVANGGYAALNRALSEGSPEDTLEQVKLSGLRGRGGAAFPTATKWSFLAGSNAPVKYILCNCEEGDPGAFNDKGILESDPHTVVEGIILAGYATGAHYGYIFIRHGHDGPIERAQTAVQQGG